MRRSPFLSLLGAAALANLAGCAELNEFFAVEGPQSQEIAQGEVPQSPEEDSGTSSPTGEIPFYDLVGAYGLEVALDTATGRRVCSDGVNEVVVIPGRRELTLNGQSYPLTQRIRWKKGTLYLPGEARWVLAENLRLAPVPEVTASNTDLFDGSDPADQEEGWLPAATSRRPRASRPPRVPALPDAWRVKSSRPWRYIVIHHSATQVGGAESFHRDHSRKWQNGLGYHFVIGNGSSTGDGEVEVGPRWLRQNQGIDGAHAGNKRYNKYGVGVCLVGQFNGDQPSPKQLEALRQLCRALMKRYGIKKDQLFRHQQVRQGHTDCPGKSFPFQAFLRSL